MLKYSLVLSLIFSLISIEARSSVRRLLLRYPPNDPSSSAFIRKNELLLIRIDPKEIQRQNPEQIKWYRWKPLPQDYNNEAHCRFSQNSFCIQEIQYQLEEITDLRGKTEFWLHSVPSLITEGTHRIDYRISSKSADGQRIAMSKVPSGAEIIIRRENSYIGFTTELLGIPFIYWPKKIMPGRHQTDHRLGADCAATLIYGQRRLGKKIPYVAPSGLKKFTKPVRSKTVRVGDLLHFGFQTAVISQDLPPFGRLSNEDKIIHSYHQSVEEIAFHQLPYRTLNFEIRRWK